MSAAPRPAHRRRHGGRSSSAARTCSTRATGSTAPHDVLVRDGRIAELGRARRRRRARRAPRSSTAQGRHLLPGLRRPPRAPAHPGPGAQGGHRDRHARRRRRRVLRGRRDAQHRPGGRLRADPALAARRRRARRARRRSASCPRSRAACDGARADRDGRAARAGRARLHRRRRARSSAPGCCAARCSTSACAAACWPCTRRTRRCRARGAMHEGEVSALLGVAGIPSVSESTMVARDAALAGYEGAGARAHAAPELRRVRPRRRARRRRAASASRAEVSPHHLCLTEEAVRTLDTRMKMNPPLRTEADRQALIDGLRCGRRSTASPPTTPRTRATRRRSPSSRRRWARPAWRRRSPRCSPTSSCPACSSLAHGRRAHDGRPGACSGSPPRAIARGRGRPTSCSSTSTRSGRSARTATRAARRTAASPAARLRGRVLLTVADGGVAYRERAFSVVGAEPAERLRPARGRHALRRRRLRRRGPRDRRGRLHDRHERLPGVDDRPVVRRPAHHLHLPAHRQLRRERRGDGVRRASGPARRSCAPRSNREDAPDRRARLAGLADRLRRARPSPASTPARWSATSALRARCAAASSPARSREAEARELVAAEPPMAGQDLAREVTPAAGDRPRRRRRTADRTRSTPASRLDRAQPRRPRRAGHAAPLLA